MLRGIKDSEAISRTGKACPAVAHAGRRRAVARFHDAQIAGHVDGNGQFAQYRGVESHGYSKTVRAASTTSSRRSRSEEHTSALQSLMRISYAVFTLKKKIVKEN